MSKQHGAREQKKAAKRKAKHAADRRELARRTSPNPTIRLQDADRWPITACLVPDLLWHNGIGNVVITRRMPGGQVACAVFLLDVFCLGVKNALWKIVSPGEFNEMRERLDQTDALHAVAPEYLAKLVYRSADYGQSLGFPPHADFRHAQRLLAGIDPSQCADEFEFGREGQPMYIRGPNESMEEARIISEHVEQLGGQFAIPASIEELLDTDPGLSDPFDVIEHEEPE